MLNIAHHSATARFGESIKPGCTDCHCLGKQQIPNFLGAVGSLRNWRS